MLEDEQVKDRTLEIIRGEHLAAEPAFVQNMRSLQAAFEDSDNDFLRARATDVRDIEHQVFAAPARGRPSRTGLVALEYDRRRP